jgi:hypothetical protein
MPLADDGLGHHRGGGGAVADGVVGLDRRFLEDLRAHVLERVAQEDLAGDGDAVVGDLGGAGDLLQHHVAALGAQGGLHGLGELVHARLEQVAGFLSELEFLGHRSSWNRDRLLRGVGRRTCGPAAAARRIAAATAGSRTGKDRVSSG